MIVAVRIRMKRMGRKNRSFFRVVAVDSRGSRDGRVLEYLGHYDPTLADTDARAVLNAERINYWVSVGAQPSEKVGVLIKKYGVNGTHAAQQQEALARRKAPKAYTPPKPLTKFKTREELEAEREAAAQAAAEPAAEESAGEEAPDEEPAAEGS
jgi:small subunit ribosomal protein S16